jgi:hypothetical protein
MEMLRDLATLLVSCLLLSFCLAFKPHQFNNFFKKNILIILIKKKKKKKKKRGVDKARELEEGEGDCFSRVEGSIKLLDLDCPTALLLLEGSHVACAA